ncbi:MAG: hypothetical protein KBA30_02435 [Clostridia bacterium]|nr:hypothetical protein [Clostridia bacterium]
MKLFTRDDLKTLMEFRSFPCLSFFVPARRMGVETRQSAVRLRNLIKRAEELLREKGERPPRIRELLVPVTDLVEDALSWEYQENGLALFLHRDGMSAYQLPFPVEESVTLSDHFRIRPLIPLVTGDGIFHLLALRLSEARLYECTRRTMQERPVPGLPASIQDILSAYDDERVYQHHASAAKGAGAAKGFNPIKENEKPRIGEYLRGVDLAAGRLLAHDRSPMVVVCVDYLFPMFKAVSRYMPLMDRHVSGSPDTLRPERMLAEAWDVVRPVFEQGRVRAFAQWEALAGTGRVLEGIARILPAAVHGRVETLFLSEGPSVRGRFDPESGHVEPAGPDADDPGLEDLFDLAAAHAYRQGGEVFLADPGSLPPGVPCVALLRY